MACSVHLFTAHRTSSSGITPPILGWALPHWTLIEKMPYSWISWWHFLNWGSFFWWFYLVQSWYTKPISTTLTGMCSTTKLGRHSPNHLWSDTWCTHQRPASRGLPDCPWAFSLAWAHYQHSLLNCWACWPTWPSVWLFTLWLDGLWLHSQSLTPAAPSWHWSGSLPISAISLSPEIFWTLL